MIYSMNGFAIRESARRKNQSQPHNRPVFNPQEKNTKQNNPLQSFYFGNVYPEDSHKAGSMIQNVYSDLKPFAGYIQASIECMRESSAEGADVTISEAKETYLEPQFTLIQPILPKNKITVEKKHDVYVVMPRDDADFDTESFEILERRDAVCTHEDKIDSYKGRVFVRLSTQPDTGKIYILYDKGACQDDPIKCNIQPVDYEDFESYRIEGIDVESVEKTETALVISTEQDAASIKEIKLFSEPVKIVENQLTQSPRITVQGASVEQLPDSPYYAVYGGKDKINVFANNKPINHKVIKLETLPEDTLQKVLPSEVNVINGRLVYRGDKTKSVAFGKLRFDIKSGKTRFRARLKDRDDNSIGTFIEVIANEKSIRDLESNVDAFFKDTTETLTDELPYNPQKCRTFKIGNKDENQSLIEIAEEKNGKLQKISAVSLPKHLYAVPNDRQLKQQKNAIYKLRTMPCSESERLLELFERKASGYGAKWDDFPPADVSDWYLLTKDDYDGCEEQREFVRKALATPDFAFLDGPPGSGKTTSILELIAQLVVQGKKVLLTASTNAAVDNILERIETLPNDVRNKILAVRIGNENTISDTVENYALSDIPREFHEEIIRRANVVCGTIFGVLRHPEFKLGDRNQPAYPLYDYLIIDEASKTTFQDFLIPALYSRHWVLSGDLKQLTPYVEQETIQLSLEEIPEFNKSYQHIQTYIQLAKDNRINKEKRFYAVVTEDQIHAAEQLITGATMQSCKFGIVTKKKSECPLSVSVGEIKNADDKAVIFFGADFLFIDVGILDDIQFWIPKDFLPTEKSGNLFLAASAEAYFKGKSRELGSGRDKGARNNLNEIAGYWKNAMKEHSWAKEITWRLCRIQELFLDAENSETVEKYRKQIEARLPSFTTSDGKDGKDVIKTYCDAIAGIALPSVLQLLQNGLSEEVRKNFKYTTLNAGFDSYDFDERHTMLTYQHRMHPSISEFSAKEIYNGEALKDGHELSQNREWSCPMFGEKRNIWIDVVSNETRSNENPDEIRRIRGMLDAFMKWTKDNPQNNGKNWSVACLTYYKRQEHQLKVAIKSLFGEQKEKSWYKDNERNIEVFIYTVDKFQGREADVVFLSLIKSGNANLGFMDSPNRLNVALTRARYQRVIVGNRKYFRNTTKSELLCNLAEQSPLGKDGGRK